MVKISLIALYDPESYAVCTLHAVLKKAGFCVKSIFVKRRLADRTFAPVSGEEMRCIADFIGKESPDLIGISVRSLFFDTACRITSEIKKQSDAFVIFGGVHPTVCPRQCLESADLVCRGEGEEAILELAAKLSGGESIERIANLWIKAGNQIIEDGLRPLAKIDSIPFPDYSPENKYFVEKGIMTPHIHQPSGFMSSRGCLFSCSYCMNAVLKEAYQDKGGHYVRYRSVDSVLDELKRLKQNFSPAYLNFDDEVLACNPQWIKDFLTRYKNEIGIPFCCYSNPLAVRDDTVRMLKDAGATYTVLGLQSGSQRVRCGYYNRRESNRDILEAAGCLRKHGLNYAVDLIMDNPLETEQDMRETFDLVLALPKPVFANIHTLTHFPGTRLTNMLLEKGMIGPDDIEDKRREGFKRWDLTLDARKNRLNMFWSIMYFFASQEKLKGLALMMSRCTFIKKHPIVLLKTIVFLTRCNAVLRHVKYLVKSRVIFKSQPLNG